MVPNKEISAQTLDTWLKENRPVSLLDIRPLDQLASQPVHGSVHYNAYDALKSNDASAFSRLFLDKSIPVVVFCEGGKSSAVAAEMLQKLGYNVLSLQGGLKSWRLLALTADELLANDVHNSPADKNG